MACDLLVELHWQSEVRQLYSQPDETSRMKDLVFQVARTIGVGPLEFRDYRFYWNDRALTWHARLVDLPGRNGAVSLVLCDSKSKGIGTNGAAPPLPRELRAEVRHPCELESACSTGARETAWPARVRDLSASGIGLVLSRWFSKGAVLDVQIQQPNGSGPRRLLARVVHVRKQSDGQWLVGCALASRLSAETLQALIAGGVSGR